MTLTVLVEQESISDPVRRVSILGFPVSTSAPRPMVSSLGKCNLERVSCTGGMGHGARQAGLFWAIY